MEKLKAFWNYLDGKKTNITALFIAINTFLLGRGLIEEDVAILIYGVLGALGLYAVRDAVKKIR